MDVCGHPHRQRPGHRVRRRRDGCDAADLAGDAAAACTLQLHRTEKVLRFFLANRRARRSGWGEHSMETVEVYLSRRLRARETEEGVHNSTCMMQLARQCTDGTLSFITHHRDSDSISTLIVVGVASFGKVLACSRPVEEHANAA